MSSRNQVIERRIAVLEDTLSWFAEKPGRRCVEKLFGGEVPAYCLSGGRFCAVGRYLRDVDEVERLYGDLSVNQIASRVNFDDLLREDVRGLGDDFWANLQYLHDGEGFWNERGLSPTGWSFVLQLLHAIGLDEATPPDSLLALARPMRADSRDSDSSAG